MNGLIFKILYSLEHMPAQIQLLLSKKHMTPIIFLTVLNML